VIFLGRAMCAAVLIEGALSSGYCRFASCPLGAHCQHRVLGKPRPTTDEGGDEPSRSHYNRIGQHAKTRLQERRTGFGRRPLYQEAAHIARQENHGRFDPPSTLRAPVLDCFAWSDLGGDEPCVLGITPSSR